MQERAREYLERGWQPLPLVAKGKKPTQDEWQKLKIGKDQIHSYFTDASNIGTLLGEPSGWLIDIDCDSEMAVAVADKLMPATGLSFGRRSTGRAHLLYVSEGVKSQRFKDPTRVKDNTIIEIRSTGGQTMFPPSVHPSGEPVKWIEYGEPAKIDKEELRRAVSIVAAGALLAENWTEGSRQDAAMHLSGALARAKWSQEEIEYFIEAVASAAGDSDVAARVRTVEYSMRKLQEGESVSGWPSLAECIPNGQDVVSRIRQWFGINGASSDFAEGGVFNQTDMGNAERLETLYGDSMRYCYELGKWLIWNGRQWEPDPGGAAHRRAWETVRQIGSEASRVYDEDARKKLLKWALTSESRAKQRDMLGLAESLLPVSQAELDTDPWLLNVQNGTVDLKKGELKPHDRTDLNTKVCPVEYRPGPAPLWAAFLEEVLPDKEVRDFVQRAVGYSLTGDCGEEVLFFLYGTGRNGKSKFIETLQHVMGDYSSSTRPEVLMEKKYDSIPVELAALKGIRFTSTVETGSGHRFAESLIKQVTGGDEVQVRHMRQDPFTYKPQFKIWLASNSKPDIKGRDQGIWSRIMMVPFTVTIPPERRDKTLGEKLKKEGAAILAWAVEGCLAWQQEGLNPPHQVRAAIQEYQDETDRLSDFFEEACIINPLARTSTADIYDSYLIWADLNHEEAVKKNTFSKMLGERGFVPVKVGPKSARGWQGIVPKSQAKKTEVLDMLG